MKRKVLIALLIVWIMAVCILAVAPLTEATELGWGYGYSIR